MKRLVLAIALGIAIPPQPGGIYRHDVDPSLYEALARDSSFDSVGKVRMRDGKTIGSFVLVDSDWVITAAHIFDGRDTLDVVLELSGQRRGVAAVVRHPDFRSGKFARHPEAIFRKGMDVALVRLDRSIAAAPATLQTQSNEQGREATFVGFGTSGTAMTAITNPVPPGIKRAGTNVIDMIGGQVDKRPIPDWYLVSDFDHPSHERLNKTGSATPLGIEFLAAGGDSGGGVFIREGAGYVLVGIHSTGRFAINDSMETDGLYGSLNLSLRISSIADWIQSTIGQ